MTELKPCPFCGSKDSVYFTTPNPDGEELYSSCLICLECLNQSRISFSSIEDEEDARQKLEELWNRRVSE